MGTATMKFRDSRRAHCDQPVLQASNVHMQHDIYATANIVIYSNVVSYTCNIIYTKAWFLPLPGVRTAFAHL